MFTCQIFSDASLTGWGVVCGGKRSHGFWTNEEQRSHINVLELKAAFFGLEIFGDKLENCDILMRLDNTTAIAYINRMGGIRCTDLNKIARTIWEWCEKRRIWVFASYINTKDNFKADFESRRLETETEFEISSEAFKKIIDSFGKPDVDLFASRVNAKCDSYVSWLRDPSSIAVDAFTISWKDFFFYAFPPFAVILRVLRKIRDERSKGIVVVPDWPCQPWFPLFHSLLISEIIVFKPNKHLLSSLNREPHPMWHNLTLVAGVLCGKPSN